MNTTIAVSAEIRDQIKELGNKGETYDEILSRLLSNAKERQLQELLMDTTNCLTVEQAREKLKR